MVEDLAAGPRVFCSGLVEQASGIGVIQRWVYPLLEEGGLTLKLSEGGMDGGGSFARLLRICKTLLAPYPLGSRMLTVVSPFPFFAPKRTVSIVMDLRWMRTRGRVSRAYRAWDMKRTVRHAQTILCISNRTREDLVAFSPASAGKARVAWLGPGIIPEGSFHEGEPGVVLLIGGASHKRNEYAAKLLSEARPSWLQSVEGVGVSRETRDILESAFGAEQCRWHERISDEDLIEVYERSEYFVLFGLEEGFGIPYIEALAAGSKVVVIDQPLTRELLGDAGCLIQDGAASAVVAQLRGIRAPAAEVRLQQAGKFSWSNCADTVSKAIRALD